MKRIFYVLIVLLSALAAQSQEKVEVKVIPGGLSSGIIGPIVNMRIGGRNYVKNSAFLENYEGWFISGDCFTEVKDGLPTIGLNRVGFYTQNGYMRCPQMDNLMLDEFTLSFMVYSLNGYVKVDFDGDYDNTITTTVPDHSWQKVVMHVNAGKVINSLNFCLYGSEEMVMDGWVTRFKLEYGNHATDWSPAPEDFFQKFSDAGIDSGNKSMSLNSLKVNGTVRAKEIVVTPNVGADFVFDAGYQLKDLSEIKAFVERHKHLPGIQPEREMLEEGVNMNEFQILLLQKIEELTLYIIKQQEEINELKSQIKR